MANRLIGGILSSKQPQSSGFVSRASTGTYFNNLGQLTIAPANQPRLNYTFSGNPIGTRYSTSFNGSAYQTAPWGANFNFGTGNFTVEGWIYLNSLASSYYVMAGTWTTGTTDEWLIQIQNNNSIRFLTTTGTTFYSATITAGTWYHIAGVRNGSTITLYVNGTSVGSYTNANSIGSVSKVTYIGAQQSPIWYVNGFISNFRITNGVAVYTGNFTVPTSPLTSTQSSGTNISAITGTQTALLTCQNNTFIDNSTNAVVLTNSSATVSTFLPPIYPSDFSGAGWSQPTTLIEPASTNIITYSEQIDNAVWSKIALGTRTGVTANAATAPDGNTTADLVYVFNGITSVSGGAYWPYTFTTGVTYTWSCYFKTTGYQYVYMGSDNNNASCAWFNLVTGTVGTASTGFRGTITNAGNSWYRCAVTFTFASASMGNAGPIMGCANIDGTVTLTQAGNGSNGVYMWGAQMEINSLGATSYIPTTTTAVTRSQDITGVVGSGMYTLAQIENQTTIDDQFTVQSFPNVGSNYNWTCPEDVTSVEVLVVAGGGGGGNAQGGGGGGGAGGLLYNVSYPVTPGTTYPVVVGAGGAGGATGTTAPGTNGQNSQFGNLIAIGGGAGSAEYANGVNGRTGGSGGGNCYSTATSGAPGITGQGFPGGVSSSVNGSGYEAGGGGGGAGGPGMVGINTGTASTSVGGNGGPGLYFNISGTNTVYAGGGGGATNVNATGVSIGGSGIGGGGGRRTSTNGGNGTVNTGSGGGGGGTDSSSSGSGGSGIVVIKYKRTNRQLAVTSNAAIVSQKFTVTNTWVAPAGVTQVEALIVAGGGGGGWNEGGGGGAGGLYYNSSMAVIPGTSYAVTVGLGGAGAAPFGVAGTGGNSSFNSVTSYGGGRGGTGGAGSYDGGNGGSGGGAARGSRSGGSATGNSVSTSGGNAGGNGIGGVVDDQTAGGGGAGGPGGSSTGSTSTSQDGNGGPGLPFNITGNLEYYAGGGAGSSYTGGPIPGIGGIGGGGRGSRTTTTPENGSPNTGGGGAGGGGSGDDGARIGGSGGSGVVILRYRVPQVATFLDSGAWTCPPGVTSVQALIVAGGGGGGGYIGAGGGAGGLIYSSNVAVTPGVTYPVVIGQGGSGGTNYVSNGTSGQNSSFSNLIAIGGGYGAGADSSKIGVSGGSGGGSRESSGANGTYGQGNTGGTGYQQSSGQAGGGGGAGSSGANGATGAGAGGSGGAGLTFTISGSSVTYAGGGGGGTGNNGNANSTGGSGGGGNPGASGGNNSGSNGIANTGGGGGGASYLNAYTSNGGTGGSGIVIIRWYGG